MHSSYRTHRTQILTTIKSPGIGHLHILYVYAGLGIINHFIFKVLIFWGKVKVSLLFEN
jgi:hypothetical protein